MRAHLLNDLANVDEQADVVDEGDVTFRLASGKVPIRLAADGRIWIDRGEGAQLAGSDKEVVDAMREFLVATGALKVQTLSKAGRASVREMGRMRARKRGGVGPDTGIRVSTAADRAPHECSCACESTGEHARKVQDRQCACDGCTKLFFGEV